VFKCSIHVKQYDEYEVANNLSKVESEKIIKFYCIDSEPLRSDLLYSGCNGPKRFKWIFMPSKYVDVELDNLNFAKVATITSFPFTKDNCNILDWNLLDSNTWYFKLNLIYFSSPSKYVFRVYSSQTLENLNSVLFPTRSGAFL
jgi:hypothetical protein